MRLELPEAISPTTLLTSAALALGSLWVYKNQLKTWRQPFIRDVVFLISVTLSKITHHPIDRPYYTNFDLITIGGMPFRSNSWAYPTGCDLMAQLLSPSYKLGLVVSMVQPHEQAGTGINLFGSPQPVQPAFWAQQGVQHTHCPMQDMSTDVSNSSALAAIEDMHKCIMSGKRVYLHCQAGRGRSFIMLMSYFLIHGEPRITHDENDEPQINHHTFRNYDEALDHVLAFRPHVSDSTARRAKIQEIVTASMPQLPPSPDLSPRT